MGAIVGAGIGYTVDRWLGAKPLPKDNKQAVSPTPTDGETVPAIAGNSAAESEQPSTAAPAAPAPHEVFGVPTHYLTASNEIFTPLTQFHMLIQFKEEREVFAKAIGAIDDVLGFETLLLTRNPLSNLMLPGLAQQARNRVRELLENIATFSNELRPSPTKLKSMKGYTKTVLETLDGIITHMHRQHAATTVYDKKNISE